MVDNRCYRALISLVCFLLVKNLFHLILRVDVDALTESLVYALHVCRQMFSLGLTLLQDYLMFHLHQPFD